MKSAKDFLFSRESRKADTVLNVAGIPIGGRDIVVAAGPCAVESEGQLLETARAVRRAGAAVLRGGAYKPRSSPYSFQGLEEKGMEILKTVKEKTGMPVVTEIMSIEDAKRYSGMVDIMQVGARNAQNFSLLKCLGALGAPVFLKNGIGNTTEEWLMASEYILSGGNRNVILCYRGIRTIETGTRFAMDVGAIASVKRRSHLPVAADPSHAAGNRNYVAALAFAAVAAGADMLEIEVHPNPENALSDREQQLDFGEFRELMHGLEAVAKALGRRIYKLGD